MKIEQRKVESLIPYVNNSRTHSDEQIAQIAASIKEFGWTNPILVDGDNGIIAGHGRLMAARKLEMDKVPVIELAHLSEAQKKALIIADNKLALNSEWDYNLLKLELFDLNDQNFIIDLIGFNSQELKSIMFNQIDEKEPNEFTGDSDNKWQILIEYKNENDLADAYEEFTERGLKCKIIQ